jgi:hypothetical protein
MSVRSIFAVPGPWGGSLSGPVPRPGPTGQWNAGRFSVRGRSAEQATQRLEQADAVLIGVQAIDVVEGERLVAVLERLQVDAERRGVTVDPARLGLDGLADALALTPAGGAAEEQEVQVAVAERGGVPPQLLVGGDDQRVFW